MTPHQTRLHLFFATENDRAVILRQGPSKHYCMILWHRDTDMFEDGQWIKQRVYTDLSDLSPDGHHFLYFTLNGDWTGESEGAYTVLSQPPYFTALALFPEGSTWGGGGRFADNTHYVATGGPDIHGRDDGLIRLMRKERTGKNPSGLWRMDGKPARLGEAAIARVHAPQAQSQTFALDRYDTQGGCLYRRAGGEMELIRDFTDMAFEPIRAPYDWRDDDAPPEEKQPWHPLDGERRK